MLLLCCAFDVMLFYVSWLRFCVFVLGGVFCLCCLFALLFACLLCLMLVGVCLMIGFVVFGM